MLMAVIDQLAKSQSVCLFHLLWLTKTVTYPFGTNAAALQALALPLLLAALA